MSHPDLSAVAVFFDFDGTISRQDVGVVLLQQAGRAGWQSIDDDYAAGRVGSREALSLQFAMLDGTEDDLLDIARSVAVDPTFVPLLNGLRAAGATVTVVSDGFGFHVGPMLEAAGARVDVITNVVDWDARDLTFPNTDRCCPCTTCGTCKQAPIRDAKAAGQRVIFVGDGTSDRKAALLADEVFATGDLAQWCDEAGVTHRWFADLNDVAIAVLGESVVPL